MASGVWRMAIHHMVLTPSPNTTSLDEPDSRRPTPFAFGRRGENASNRQSLLFGLATSKLAWFSEAREPDGFIIILTLIIDAYGMIVWSMVRY